MTEAEVIAKRREQEEERTLRIRKGIFAESLKKIKKTLPSNCTFLSPYVPGTGEYKGQHMVRARVNGEYYHFSIPQDFDMTNAHIQELHSQILEICNKQEK